MVSNVGDWWDTTVRPRAGSIAIVAAVALVVLWFNRDDPFPTMLLWAGFTLILAGARKLFLADASSWSRPAVGLILGGIATLTAAEWLDGEGWSGAYVALGVVVVSVIIARRQRASAARAA
jgi:energy-coupling factor transporter transmembrane protein EcfT